MKNNLKAIKGTKVVKEVLRIKGTTSKRFYTNKVSSFEFDYQIEGSFFNEWVDKKSGKKGTSKIRFIEGYERMLGKLLYKDNFTQFIRNNPSNFYNKIDDYISELNCILLEVLKEVKTKNYSLLDKDGNISDKSEFYYIYGKVSSKFVSYCNKEVRRVKINRNTVAQQKRLNNDDKANTKLENLSTYKYIQYVNDDIYINNLVLDQSVYDVVFTTDLLQKVASNLTPKRKVILKALYFNLNINKELQKANFKNANVKEVEKVKTEIRQYLFDKEVEKFEVENVNNTFINSIVEKDNSKNWKYNAIQLKGENFVIYDNFKHTETKIDYSCNIEKPIQGCKNLIVNDIVNLNKGAFASMKTLSKGIQMQKGLENIFQKMSLKAK